jgi:hypothetical protein
MHERSTGNIGIGIRRMTCAWASHGNPSSALLEGIKTLHHRSKCPYCPQDNNQSLLCSSFLTHPLVLPSNIPVTHWWPLKVPVSFFYFCMSLIPLSLSFPDWPFNHWLASSPDFHPFPHWSGQISPGLTDSYISSRPLMHGLFVALMMEAACTSEASVHFHVSTWLYIPESCHVHTHCH